MVSFDLKEAAAFLKVHPVTLQRMAKNGDLPACKIGRSWVFIEEHLVEHMSSEYANRRGNLRLVDDNESQENKKCQSTKKVTFGTSITSTATASVYANLLALPTSKKHKNCTTN